MKKFLIILVLAGLSEFIFSQTQYKLPIESGTWKVENVYCEMKETVPGNGNWEETHARNYNYFSSIGDSMINDTNYFIIESSREGILGAVRQDSLLVFYRPLKNSEFSEEVLLYDFSVTDTFSIKTVHETIETFNVLSIDIIEIEGVKRKRIEFDDNSGLYIGKYWIEGIGSTGGILKPYYPTPIPTCSDCCGVEENLVCLINNDEELLYLNDSYYNCDSLLLSIPEQRIKETLSFRINGDILTISSFTPQQKIEKIELFDSLGRLVFWDKCKNQEYNQIRLMKNRINIIRVTTDAGYITKKFIIESNR